MSKIVIYLRKFNCCSISIILELKIIKTNNLGKSLSFSFMTNSETLPKHSSKSKQDNALCRSYAEWKPSVISVNNAAPFDSHLIISWDAQLCKKLFRKNQTTEMNTNQCAPHNAKRVTCKLGLLYGPI